MAYEYVTSTGTIVPDTSELLADVQNEWRSAFGQDLIVTNETPQGVLITAEVAARDAVARNNALLANQINPNLAGGVFLDAIWSLTSITGRMAATHSTVQVTLSGVPNSVIPVGTVASVGPTGGRFQTTELVTLNATTGLATTTMVAVDAGPVPAPANALTTIQTAAIGLEGVTNPAAATLGTAQETDVQARYRRRVTLASQGTSLPEAIISGLMDAQIGVTSVAFRENTTAASAVIDGITLLPHSIWCCVAGGSDVDVAAVILAKKSAGCNYNGATTAAVTDAASGQTYLVKFDRPTEVPLTVRVTARFNTTDGYAIIPQAIVDYANGNLDGDPGLVIGQAVSPFELSGAINQVEPRIQVTNLELSINGGSTWSTATVPIDLNERATVVLSSVVVIPV